LESDPNSSNSSNLRSTHLASVCDPHDIAHTRSLFLLVFHKLTGSGAGGACGGCFELLGQMPMNWNLTSITSLFHRSTLWYGPLGIAFGPSTNTI